MKQIDKLIINPPYEEPKYYWHYDREHRSFEKREVRTSPFTFTVSQL